MIEKAKQVCCDYASNGLVTFHQSTLEEFLDENPEKAFYDAIVAATSFHWAIDSEGRVVSKCHELLKDGEKLILLWNIPPEPTEDVRDSVAAATNKTVPFYFSAKNAEQHRHDIHANILQPVESTGVFTEFSMEEYPSEMTVQITHFTSMVRTFSHYICMTDEERESFFDTAERAMAKMSGSSIEVAGLSLLNVSTKV